MFGFFGTDKKKEDAPAPQTQQPAQPQRIIEKGNYKHRLGDTEGTRGNAICNTFGTTDLDLVLERYAPEQMDKIKSITNNQKIIYDELVDHRQKLQQLTDKMDYLFGVLGEIYEAVLKKELVKEPRCTPPEK